MTRPIPSRAAPGQRETPWAGGLTVFAAVIMLGAGVCHALAGIAALVRDDVYVATPQYIYSFDLTGWGWAHMLLGILIAGAGVAVLQGQTWGRAVGVVLASLSLIANFLFIPYYPIWSLVIIALDVAIIWALTVYRREAA